ncbi:hypothetical protein FSARC_8497 [Fusarium sarcochroum]|uniref:Apple domain-containing protein n=1 Tax=Fusarium sarcochroum TaxID=1208366 RepID=A0A8H4TT36_9HYPO|nr:hypothetical protein FSARC_8497 [Fusarium sarcochroum]
MARLALVLFFTLLGVVVAQTSTFSNEICSTRFARSSVQPVPSTTTTRSFTLTAFSYGYLDEHQYCDSPIVYGYVHQHIVLTQTDTTTSISTVVVTTTTVTTSTTTVPTPVGFTPVALQTDYVAKRKRGLSKRCKRKKPKVPKTSDTPKTNNSTLRNTIKRVGNSLAFSPLLYPQVVSCRDTFEVVVTSSITRPSCRQTPTTTVTLPTITSTARTSTTTVVTSTSTQPDASTTVTTSAIVTVMTTTTSTATSITSVTSTATSVAPAQTTYAACSANNLVNSANGGHSIESLSISGTFLQANVNTPYDCCVSCQLTANCVGAGFADSKCSMVIGTTCDATSEDQAGFGTEDTTDLYLTISNGPCGQLANNGDQPSN